ncbi:molybdenum cofactor cytidylyltransferase [Rhodobacteraceae bacterium MBR-64]|jgi:CTP:molybdopterin cytidylyltransferase MocA
MIPPETPAPRTDQPRAGDDIAILIPAAGASRRMRGTDKLLEPVNGVPLLRHQALRALQTGAPVLVTLPGDRPARRDCLADLPVRLITVPDPTEGIAASIRAGVAGLCDKAQAVMILLADLPEVTTDDLAAMIAAFRADPAQPILRACADDGTPGHPVIFARRHFPALSRLTGDSGARAILARAPDLRPYPLPGTRATTDLDTPEAWAHWRARNGAPGSKG